MGAPLQGLRLEGLGHEKCHWLGARRPRLRRRTKPQGYRQDKRQTMQDQAQRESRWRKF
jgi:hypothetical protein